MAYPNYAQRAQERYLKSQTGPEEAPFLKRIRMPQVSFPQNWWMWLAGFLIVALAIWLAATGNVRSPDLKIADLSFPQSPEFNITITLATVALFAINLWGFAEAYSRKERILLDWWIAPITALVLVNREALGHNLWLILTTLCGAGLGVATFLNESQEQKGRFEWIDLTSLMNIAGILIVLNYANWPTLPYPAYIPVWVVWIVFLGCAIRELVRTSFGLGFFALATGVASAITLNPWIIAISLCATVVGVHFAAKRGWVPTTKHREEVQILAGTGRELSIVVPWDVVSTQTYVFAITSFILYRGDFILTTLTGGK